MLTTFNTSQKTIKVYILRLYLILDNFTQSKTINKSFLILFFFSKFANSIYHYKNINFWHVQ